VRYFKRTLLDACVLLVGLVLITSLSALVAEPLNANGWPAASNEVTGCITQIEGIRVLHVWGTPDEQGHALGYLLAPEIVGFYDRFIGYRTWNLDAERWDSEVLSAADRFSILPEYMAELGGMIRGIEARAGGPVEVPSLGRTLRIDDLIAGCYAYDDRRLGCTSFVAWGSMTEDGRALVGRNMDWPALPAFLETPQVVVVRAPWPESDRCASVSVFYPPMIGITTGMNADGIVLCNNDAYNERDPVRASGFFPFLLSNRTALESARAGRSRGDIAAALRAEPSGIGRSLTVATLPDADGARGLVYESDGIWEEASGLTVRRPEATEPFILTTMHHRERAEPIDCPYYDIGEQALRAVATGEASPLTVASVWDLLTDLTPTSGLTFHSVVFEPDSMTMHLRLQEDGVSAQYSRTVTLDVDALFRGLPEEP